MEQLRTGVTFDVVADEWLAWGIRDRDWKPSSLSDYRSALGAHLLHAFRGKRIEKIDADEIEQWRDELIDERGLSRCTANKLLIILGAIFDAPSRLTASCETRRVTFPSSASAMTPTHTISSRPARSSSSPTLPRQTRTGRSTARPRAPAYVRQAATGVCGSRLRTGLNASFRSARRGIRWTCRLGSMSRWSR
jgi:hypothetical protein